MNSLIFTVIYLAITVTPALYYFGTTWIDIQKYSTHTGEQDAE